MNTGEGSPHGRSDESRKKPRLRRTLIGAAIGALLAMSMVPYVKGHRYAAERGYLPIYEIGGRADVNVAQLVLNISFAALVGALACNLSRRAVLRVLAVAGIVTGVFGLWGTFRVFQAQMKAGAEREETLGSVNTENGNFDAAKEHLLKASNYWWWKGWWDGARIDRERALDQEGMKKEAAVFRAKDDEARVMKLLGMTNPFDQFHLPPFYRNGQKVKEAKQLLLDAAEKWNAAGSTYEEQRVRTWEKNLKSADEFFAGLPDQPWPGKYISTDPNFGLKEQRRNDGFHPSEPQIDWSGLPSDKAAIQNAQIPDWAKDAPSPFADLAAKAQPADPRQWESEEAQCRQPFPYPPHKWTHVTEFGKTFAIIKFRERKAGDRKTQLDGYAKAIGAKFYKQWSRVTQGGADWVEIVFYK